MQFSNLQTKRHFVAGKWIVGIDPAKDKFDAAVIDPMGILQGKTFTIQNNHDGFQMQLFNCLNKRIVSIPKENILFAIEAACNLWQKLANFLISKGFSVVIINPRSTHKSRSLINHNASKTDAKDALVVANAARGGYFDFYRVYPDQTRALHDLAVTYDKLKRSLAQAKLRLRALVEQTFPEFTDIIKMNTQTAIYLLDNFIIPQEFLDADVFSTVRQMKQVTIS